MEVGVSKRSIKLTCNRCFPSDLLGKIFHRYSQKRTKLEIFLKLALRWEIHLLPRVRPHEEGLPCRKENGRSSWAVKLTKEAFGECCKS
jgi:hypothetical protein